MGGSRRSAFFAALGRSFSSVVPTGLTWSAFPAKVTVHFSGALQSATLSKGSWSVRRANQRWNLGAVTASGSDVIVNQLGGVADVGADYVAYDGVAGDLKDASGDEVAAFSV